MKTNISNLVASVESIELTPKHNRYEAAGVTKINDVDYRYSVNERFGGEIEVVVESLDLNSLKALGIEVDFAYIIAEYKVLKDRNEKKKEAEKKVNFETRFETHGLQVAKMAFPKWNLNMDKDEWVSSMMDNSFNDRLRLEFTAESVSTDFRIHVNEKGQYVLHTANNYEPIKTSKYIKNIITAYNDKLVSLGEAIQYRKEVIAKSKATHKTAEEELGMKVNSIKESRRRRHVGRGQRNFYDVDRLEVILKLDKESDYRTQKVLFTRSEDGSYNLDKLQVRDLTADQMKQLIAVFK
jgi:hypothetical protein